MLAGLAYRTVLTCLRSRAGPTNAALGLIDFPTLADYELYREKLMSDADAVEALRQVGARAAS